MTPLLFLIYINDLPLHVSDKVRLYADHVILYSYIYSMDDCRKLQKDLDSLTQWSCKWQMQCNPRKCEFLRITNKNNHILFNYHINDCSIQEVTHAKYLGVVLDQHLSWNDHIKRVSSEATKVNTFLHRNFYQCPPLYLQSYGQIYHGILVNYLGPSHINIHQPFRICSKTCCMQECVSGIILDTPVLHQCCLNLIFLHFKTEGVEQNYK